MSRDSREVIGGCFCQGGIRPLPLMEIGPPISHDNDEVDRPKDEAGCRKEGAQTATRPPQADLGTRQKTFIDPRRGDPSTPGVLRGFLGFFGFVCPIGRRSGIISDVAFP